MLRLAPCHDYEAKPARPSVEQALHSNMLFCFLSPTSLTAARPKSFWLQHLTAQIPLHKQLQHKLLSTAGFKLLANVTGACKLCIRVEKLAALAAFLFKSLGNTEELVKHAC